MSKMIDPRKLIGKIRRNEETKDGKVVYLAIHLISGVEMIKSSLAPGDQILIFGVHKVIYSSMVDTEEGWPSNRGRRCRWAKTPYGVLEKTL